MMQDASEKPDGTVHAAQPVALIGRQYELGAVVNALLGASTPVLIRGEAGIGKTTLAQAVLEDERLVGRFGERRLFARCARLKTPAELRAAVSVAAGFPAGSRTWPELLAWLGEAPTLVLLDDAESPEQDETTERAEVGIDEQALELALARGVVLLGTLRTGRQPYSLRWRTRIDLAPLPMEDARRLFLEIAGERAAEASDLDRIVEAQAGLPLGLVIAAAASRPGDLAQPATRGAEMDRPAAAGAERSVELLLAEGGLPRPARRLLTVLGLLPGGIERTDLETILPNLEPEGLELLIEERLVSAGPRLQLHARLREYVAGAAPPETEDEKRLVAFYLDLARTEGEKVGWEEGGSAVERLIPEVENVEFILLRALNSGEPEPALEAAVAHAEFLRFTGAGTLLPLKKARAAAVRVGDERLLADVLYATAMVNWSRSDHDTARACFEEALPLFRRVGDVLGEANCIQRLGDLALRRSDHDSARARFEEALPLYRRVGAVLGEANCIQSLGDLALARSDHDSARARFEEALPLYRRVGDVLGEANCIQRLGDLALARSDHDTARARFEEALPLYRRVGDVLGEANCIVGLADVARDTGALDEAAEGYRQALGLYEQFGDPYSLGRGHERLASVTPDSAERQRHAEMARRLFASIGL